MKWAAFYGDCEHEILPVTSGTRITLTYRITQYGKEYQTKIDEKGNKEVRQLSPMYLDRQQSLEGFVGVTYVGAIPEEQVRRAGKSFLNALHHIGNTDRWIGVILAHRYTETGIQPENLKGIDRALYSLASKEANKQTVLLPVLIHEDWPWTLDSCRGEEYDIPPENAATVYAFTPSDIAYFSHASETLDPLPVPEDADIRFVQLSFGLGLYFKRHQNEEAGNSVEAGNADGLYMASALLIGPTASPT